MPFDAQGPRNRARRFDFADVTLAVEHRQGEEGEALCLRDRGGRVRVKTATQ
jgi:hypothetical protein